MATEYDIIQKQFNGIDYDTLYPQTTSQQILLNDDAISYSGTATVNGALTKQQTDIAQLNDKFTSYLPADTNIDNWDTTGFWLYQRTSPKSHTGTFPYSDTYGTLVHVQGTSANMAMQMIRSNALAASTGALYIRFRVNGIWGAWLTYEDNNKFAIETKTLSVPDVAAGSTEWVTASIAKSGYDAVGVLGWYFTGGTANTWLFPYSMRAMNNNINVAVRNLGTVASSGVSLQIDVLYQKAV